MSPDQTEVVMEPVYRAAASRCREGSSMGRARNERSFDTHFARARAWVPAGVLGSYDGVADRGSGAS